VGFVLIVLHYHV